MRWNFGSIVFSSRTKEIKPSVKKCTETKKFGTPYCTFCCKKWLRNLSEKLFRIKKNNLFYQLAYKKSNLKSLYSTKGYFRHSASCKFVGRYIKYFKYTYGRWKQRHLINVIDWSKHFSKLNRLYKRVW